MNNSTLIDTKIINQKGLRTFDYKNLLDSLMEINNDFVWFVDKNFRLILFNQNFGAFFSKRYSREIKINDDFFSIINIHEKDFWQESINKTLNGHKFFIDYSFDNYENDYYRIYFNPIRNGEEVIGVSIYAQNISESKLAEEKMLKSELLSQSILSTSPDGIVTTELDGTISFASDKFMQMVGNISIEELFGKKLSDFVFKEDSEKFIENLHGLSQGKHCNSYIFRLIRNDGTFFYVESKIDVIRNEEGQPIQILFILRDITDRIEAELEREKLLQDIAYSRDQIEQEAAKYVELNNQLFESERKLEELNSAKDKLFSIIGHDLKNPFITLLGFSEMLVEDFNELSDEEKKEYIKTIYDTARNTQKLLENLLSWARAQSGRLQINLEPLSIKNLIKENIELVKSQAEKKNIKITVSMNSSLMVYADKNLLDTIIRNLLTNAIKFTGENGTIKIITKDEDGFVKICVEDTGVGLSEEDVKKLFRIDVNVKEIGKSKEKGTGLGLILCKEFCEKQGGKIWVESQWGKGSKFYFTVPIYSPSK